MSLQFVNQKSSPKLLKMKSFYRGKVNVMDIVSLLVELISTPMHYVTDGRGQSCHTLSWIDCPNPNNTDLTNDHNTLSTLLPLSCLYNLYI